MENERSSGFKKEALVAAVDQLKEVTTTPDLIALRKAKDKLDTLKAKWNIGVKLRYQIPGWGWDKATQLFLASPEQWGRCIEVVSLIYITQLYQSSMLILT